ncbi:G-type lectin S-receptor-like serine/threonine-protein kinase [Citrus sinensis]|uniref:G-type lectin S-receptor-like serine/threonine-protein kinase n=1 Tax=Citrus sinensis TaxID=2711 RepID=A0ACB8NZP7_CITSI|nr:G-type lectin S-receptor-like serine/threonine-protein kinase [Citrus sinensis]
MVSKPVRASSSTQQTNQQSQINFSFNTPITLDRSNYLLWRFQVLASIRGNRLEGFINGTKPAPEEQFTQVGADGSIQKIDNPEYQNWRSQDQTLFGWMLSSISEGTLNLVINCGSSFDVWRTLEKKFGVQSEARVFQLRYELNTLRKESMSIEDYCMKMKTVADKLASAGSPITEKDLMLTILNSLGAGYRDIATFITGSKMDYDDAYALLLTHETRLEQEQNDKSMFNANYAYTNAYYPRAFYAQSRNNFRRGGHAGAQFGNNGRNHTARRGNIFQSPRMFNGNHRGGYGRGHSFGPNNVNSFHALRNSMQFTRTGVTNMNGPQGIPSNAEELVCQICFKPGHTADICWHRFVEDYVPYSRSLGRGKGPRSAYIANFDGFTYPYQGYDNYDNHPASETSCYSGIDNYALAEAYVANFESFADDGWYLDNRATHHLTNNMENLHFKEDYKGTDQLIIGNGQGLSISHIGHAFLSFRASKHPYTHASTITLKDMLLVPTITKNLLSISKLTSDNSLSVEFCGNVCYVKDMKGQVLLQGLAEKGLYKLLMKSSSMSSFAYHASPAFHLSQLQSHKPISMLSCSNVSSISHHCNSFDKTCFSSISNKCNRKHDELTLLHKKFGHPSSTVLMHFLKTCKPVKVSQKSILSPEHSMCEACQLGKAHKQHFSTTETKTTQVLELIHTDLWGPSPTTYRNGFKYYISFVDDYSSFEDTYSVGVPSDEQSPVVPEHTNNLNQQESSNYSLSKLSISQVIPQIPEYTQTQLEPQTSNQQHSENNPNRIQISQPTHKMITRSKSGIFKPKLYTTTLINKEPDTIQEALNDKNWYKAMKEEYEALIRNKTWSLVPPPAEYKIVGNKWVFRVKQNSDGSIAKYKLDWLLKVDVNNAFLNGDLTEDVYMYQPEGFVDEKRSGYVFVSNALILLRFSRSNFPTPVKTVVWVTNRIDPINDSSGLLVVNETGNLVLTSQNKSVVWSANLSKEVQTPVVLQLLDSGNLVLRGERDGSSETYLWQSFDYPSNTLLPRMKLGWDLKTGLERRITSWKSPDDPSPGNFTWAVERQDNPELIMWKGSRKFHRGGPWNGLVFNEDELYYTFDMIDKDVFSRIVMNQTLYVRQQFTWDKATQSWELYANVPRDLCDTCALCGAYGICIISDTPFCQCLKGVKGEPRTKIVVIVISTTALLAAVLIAGYLVHKRRRNIVATIANATNNFSINNKLAEGGFGPVYKGTLVDGQEIAVKRLSKISEQGLKELKNEVILFSKLQHRNLVKFLGCCIQGEEKLLIYEFMPNKSLNSFIFGLDQERCKILDWPKRFHIICGTARGVMYLHQDSRLRIIHRDLKASNVLLNQDMNPKISDFGLARAFGGDEIEGNTNRVIGTYGYMAPEYASDGKFSVKSDVFSFGILLLEIISGKKNRGFYHSDNKLNLIGHAWKLRNEGMPSQLIDPCIQGSFNLAEVI